MSKTCWTNFARLDFACSLYLSCNLYCKRVLNGSMTKQNQNIQTKDQKSQVEVADKPRKKFKHTKIGIILAAMGPGIITAMAGNDAGGIATYSTAGANFGYATL